ncbi:hypothetical protein EUGRSUZ_E00398 [Eucalyptus grandis]|uniref:Uncharacterized protein n=2 Tax=Eucalyptus grandis TaxID=71139 RepID=A0ACC3KS49_EUCGR|nr:hypothetical protein EUGRSUZ_E00398 [Eucalyptus grandis]
MVRRIIHVGSIIVSKKGCKSYKYFSIINSSKNFRLAIALEVLHLIYHQKRNSAPLLSTNEATLDQIFLQAFSYQYKNIACFNMKQHDDMITSSMMT